MNKSEWVDRPVAVLRGLWATGRGTAASVRSAVGVLAAAVVAASVLVACGGGGTVPVTSVALRPLPAVYSQTKAVNYSPYRTVGPIAGQPPLAETVAPAFEPNIKQDLDLLIKAGFGLIRMFDAGNAAEATLRVIRNNSLPIKVQLGLYIQSGDDSFNQGEIARGVALAKQYSDIVVAVSVGNETMVSWSFNPSTPAVIGGYITQVRNKVSQPVTTDDNWAFWAAAPSVVTDVIDFAALHTYTELDTVFAPDTWDWKQRTVAADKRAVAMMDASIVAAQKDYDAARSFLDSKNLQAMPIIIGETGWNAVDVGKLAFRAHPVNQKMYFDRLQAWAKSARDSGKGPKTIFYFEAFDEPWKQSDDKWGLFNVNRQARYVVQALNPASASWVYEPGSYKDSDALYFVPPVVNPAIDAARYTLYADTVTAGEVRPPAAGALTWNAWDGTTAIGKFVTGVGSAGDAANSFEITPVPKVWGWGMFYGSDANASANLSNFAANGHLRFSIKTSYPGKFELGFFTNTSEGGTADAYIPISNGLYGYVNDDQWHQVVIPLKDIVKGNGGDLSMVIHRFVIADRFATTGKTSGTTGLPKISIDAVYFTKD